MNEIPDLENVRQVLLTFPTTEDALNYLKKKLICTITSFFKKHGPLPSMVFFVTSDLYPEFILIPSIGLETPEGKTALKYTILDMCKDPKIIAAGMIVNGSAKILKNEKNDETQKNDFEDTQDIIMLIFSTPSNEEAITYYVNSETKTILGKTSFTNVQCGGKFSNFFELRKATMN